MELAYLVLQNAERNKAAEADETVVSSTTDTGKNLLRYIHRVDEYHVYHVYLSSAVIIFLIFIFILLL